MTEPASDLAMIAGLIKEKCGLRCDGDGQQALAAALGKRLPATGLPSMAAYGAKLAVDGDEFQALVNLLTINETYFYREPEHLRLLVRHVRRILGRRPVGEPIRILCAGCATGEEPYSAVIALKEEFGETASSLFQVEGVDIDSDALAKAQAGRYGDLSFRGIPADLKTRYFVADPAGGSVLAREVRTGVRFRQCNLLAEEGTAELGCFDAIFFRNVSIYFDTPTRRRIVARLAGMLTDEGCLVVGASETLSNDFGLLQLVEEEGVFYFVKDERPRPRCAPEPSAAARKPAPRPPASPRRSPPPASPAAAAAPAAGRDVAEVVRLIREKYYDKALALLDRWPAGADGHRLRAQVLFNRNDLAGAEAEARQAIAREPWCVDCLVLLGQIARQRDDQESAVRWLKQAVYAHPDSWLAHYCLAEVYRRCGSADKARREYGVVVQQLSAPGMATGGVPLFPLAVAPADLRRLCQRHLDALAAG
jgi:chemotaxis protein methyltransferase CheR